MGFRSDSCQAEREWKAHQEAQERAELSKREGRERETKERRKKTEKIRIILNFYHPQYER